MAKYSFEFKRKTVLAYLDKKASYDEIAKNYSMPSSTPLKRWVRAYRELGDDGLMRSRKNETYTFDFKIRAVELYLSSEYSYQDLASALKMNNPSLITKWVNDFRIAGPEALRERKRGRKKSLNTDNKNNKVQPVPEVSSVDSSAEHIKQLEEELLKLKIENAYLKELRRLRLEEEILLKKQRESSTASEDNSN